MLSTGIPHGALDHLAFFYTHTPRVKQIYNYRFFAFYLSIIAIYGLFWFLWTELSMLIFLAISCYHFGQSQLYYLQYSESNIFKMVLYLIWGALILAGITLFHPQETVHILGEVIDSEAWVQLLHTSLLHWLGLGGLIWICLMGMALYQRKLSLKNFVKEILWLSLLLVLFYVTPLLVSFAIYFALWHSVQAICKEMQAFREQGLRLDWLAFYKAALPFSVISFIGIGLLIAVSYYLNTMISPYLLFFIAISVLTMPHMVVMHKVYE